MSRKRFLFGLSVTDLAIVILFTGLVVWSVSAACSYVRVNLQVEPEVVKTDLRVRLVMEHLHPELVKSSASAFTFYPEGPGPYTAVSFPRPRDLDRDGKPDQDAKGRLVSSQTVLYHFYGASTKELRRTVIEPRDTSLSSEQRYRQLRKVVTRGKAGRDGHTETVYHDVREGSIRLEAGKGDPVTLANHRE